MLFLGTCAADGMPNPFCVCKICQDARQNPRHQRFRSMMLLDEKNLIDFGPDLNAACAKAGVELSILENIYITHTHVDHFCHSNVGLMEMSITRREAPVDVFLSEAGYKRAVMLMQAFGDDLTAYDPAGHLGNDQVRLHPVKVGTPFKQGGYQILAVPTTHRVSESETAVNYLFEKDGFRLLYACDTGYYQPEAIELLRGSQVDVLVLEATWGNRTDTDTASHLNCTAYLEMLDMLQKADIIRPDTKCYASHINHKHDLTHDLMQQWFDEHAKLSVTVAWDGLRTDG